jgi:hypothetical protein
VSPILMLPGGGPWFAETIDWRSSDPHAVLKIGIPKARFRGPSARGHSWTIGQLYGVVATGLINVEHIFRGFRRPMCVDDDMSADQQKLAFIWTPRHDAKMSADGMSIERVAAPPKCAFFVHVSPNDHLDAYPEIFGWAEHWGLGGLIPISLHRSIPDSYWGSN